MLGTGICGVISAGIPSSLVGGLLKAPQQYRRLHDFPSTIEPEFRSRTCICFQFRLTDDRGTHSAKKGPLFYVNSAKVGEEKQGCRNPGNGKVVDPSKTHTSRSIGHTLILRRTYFSRTNGQMRINTLSPKGMRVSQGFVF